MFIRYSFLSKYISNEHFIEINVSMNNLLNLQLFVYVVLMRTFDVVIKQKVIYETSLHQRMFIF